MKILLVEDNLAITRGLEYAFEGMEYSVYSCPSIEEVQNYLKNETPNMIVMDICLKDGNGLEFYEEEIKRLNIPTIFLTAQDDEETVVKGLILGEDYLTKPFSTKELLIRIEKILRRKNENTVIRVSDISFDMDKMVVYRKDERLDLTSIELKILHLLFLNLNKVVRRGTIIEKVWEWTGNDIEDNTVTVYMKRIREKLGTDIIVTHKGIGYHIDKDEK